jgi:hypothetical protein
MNRGRLGGAATGAGLDSIVPAWLVIEIIECFLGSFLVRVCHTGHPLGPTHRFGFIVQLRAV